MPILFMKIPVIQTLPINVQTIHASKMDQRRPNTTNFIANSSHKLLGIRLLSVRAAMHNLILARPPLLTFISTQKLLHPAHKGRFLMKNTKLMIKLKGTKEKKHKPHLRKRIPHLNDQKITRIT